MIPLERRLSFRLPLLSGADIRLAQQALRRAGMGNLATDGIFGPATRDAVRRFQQAQSLAADGILGPASWARLRSSGEGLAWAARRASRAKTTECAVSDKFAAQISACAWPAASAGWGLVRRAAA